MAAVGLHTKRAGSTSKVTKTVLPALQASDQPALVDGPLGQTKLGRLRLFFQIVAAFLRLAKYISLSASAIKSWIVWWRSASYSTVPTL